MKKSHGAILGFFIGLGLSILTLYLFNYFLVESIDIPEFYPEYPPVGLITVIAGLIIIPAGIIAGPLIGYGIVAKVGTKSERKKAKEFKQRTKNINNIAKTMSVEYQGIFINPKSRNGLLTLELSNRNLRSISEIHGLEHLKDLESLILKNNGITEINGLDSLTNLKFLDLSYNHISKIENLERLTNLEYLNLQNNQIRTIEGLDTLEKLIGLRLDSNEIADIKSFQNKPNLRQFNFKWNPLHEDVSKTFGYTSIQALIQYSQMSDEEKRVNKQQIQYEKEESWERTARVQEETRRKRIIKAAVIVGLIVIAAATSPIWGPPLLTLIGIIIFTLAGGW